MHRSPLVVVVAVVVVVVEHTFRTVVVAAFHTIDSFVAVPAAADAAEAVADTSGQRSKHPVAAVSANAHDNLVRRDIQFHEDS